MTASNEAYTDVEEGRIAFWREMLPFFRVMDDERDVEAGVVRRPLVPRHAGPVVGPVEDDGFTVELVCLKLVEMVANLLIEHGEAVMVLCSVLSNSRGVGVVRWEVVRAGAQTGALDEQWRKRRLRLASSSRRGVAAEDRRSSQDSGHCPRS